MQKFEGGIHDSFWEPDDLRFAKLDEPYDPKKENALREAHKKNIDLLKQIDQDIDNGAYTISTHSRIVAELVTQVLKSPNRDTSDPILSLQKLITV
jgi:hypothetical protein